VALVTGGTSGIGAAVVRRFLAEGAKVVVLARDADDFPSGEAVFVAGDVRSSDDNARAVSIAVARFGRLDVFVGNAGVYDNRHAFGDFTADAFSAAFDELFAINVKGYALGALAALPELRRRKGAILFTGSVSSVTAGFGGAIYIAAKHAIAGLTRQLAYELAPMGVSVNCVAPGYAATALKGLSALSQGPTTSALSADRLPLGVIADNEDYADAYVLLASDAGRRMATGSVFMLDGGLAQTGPGPRQIRS
jgi:NAD(P)-dependent dehydrogenase (short-subunit alcohol dehydrogenase family)